MKSNEGSWPLVAAGGGFLVLIAAYGGWYYVTSKDSEGAMNSQKDIKPATGYTPSQYMKNDTQSDSGMIVPHLEDLPTKITIKNKTINKMDNVQLTLDTFPEDIKVYIYTKLEDSAKELKEIRQEFILRENRNITEQKRVLKLLEDRLKASEKKLYSIKQQQKEIKKILENHKGMMKEIDVEQNSFAENIVKLEQTIEENQESFSELGGIVERMLVILNSTCEGETPALELSGLVIDTNEIDS